ncbi:MAG: nucleoside deaminase [Verrucomicrobiota bacterium]
MNITRLLQRLASALSLVCVSAAFAAAPAMPSPLPDDPTCTPDDRKFMTRAFELARFAMARGDGAIGAVLVSKDGKILAEFGNMVTTESDVTLHGETGLISYASRVLPKAAWEGSTLYTSLEPCVMCCGSIRWAGIATVVYGGSSRQPTGAPWGPERLRAREVYQRTNAAVKVRGPLMDDEQIKLRGEQARRVAVVAKP